MENAVYYLWRIDFNNFSLGALFIRRIPTRNSDMETICETIDYSSKEMIKTKSFWILFFWGIGVAGAGYILMAHANGILNEAISTVDASLAATIVGLISIANGLGRMIYGFLWSKRRNKCFN